jgi:hypothetical protein
VPVTLPEGPQNCARCPRTDLNYYSYRYREVDTGKKKEWVLSEVVCEECDTRERWDEFVKTSIYRTHLLMDLVFLRHPGWTLNLISSKPEWQTAAGEAKQFQDELHAAIKTFEEAVWFNGLQREVRASKRSGQRVVTDSLKWLVWSSAGRTMITLEDFKTKESVTVITAEDEDRRCMGMQGIEAHREAALSLLQTAIDVWRNHPQVVADDEVGMI